MGSPAHVQRHVQLSRATPSSLPRSALASPLGRGTGRAQPIRDEFTCDLRAPGGQPYPAFLECRLDRMGLGLGVRLRTPLSGPLPLCTPRFTPWPLGRRSSKPATGPAVPSVDPTVWPRRRGLESCSADHEAGLHLPRGAPYISAEAAAASPARLMFKVCDGL